MGTRLDAGEAVRIDRWNEAQTASPLKSAEIARRLCYLEAMTRNSEPAPHSLIP